jgi:hypothetical protein
MRWRRLLSASFYDSPIVLPIISKRAAKSPSETDFIEILYMLDIYPTFDQLIN